MRTRGVRLLGLVLAVLLLAAACGDDDDASSASTAAAGATTTAPRETTTTGSATGEITVFAAASLTDAFTQISSDFEAANPAVNVNLNFGASSSLREQILAGAPADVFASANTSNMDQLVDADAVEGEAETFATNNLAIAVPPGNPGNVTGLADFGNADLLIGLCAEEVPCGQFGREALTNAGVTPAVDTNAPDVRSLLTQIEAGELDAGIVYETDVLAAGTGVEGIEIPADQNVVATYPIAALSASTNNDASQVFVNYVLSTEGQATLASFGFGPP